METEGSKLVIDPGSFTKLPNDLKQIAVIIVTEEHMDHFNLDNIQKILAQSPDAQIFTTAVVSSELAKGSIKSEAINGERTLSIKDFTFTLREVDHAPTYQTSPCKSLTVTVGSYLYYPSDSYELTNTSIEVLALPTSGPWYKVEESITFANQITSEKVVATHNALNSDIGNSVTHHFIQTHLSHERTLVLLQPGESLGE